jgi:hypothetical protein
MDDGVIFISLGNENQWFINKLKGVKMYQVTAIYQGCEIGYGEGESLGYAKQDCIDSIDTIYLCDKASIKLSIIKNQFNHNAPYNPEFLGAQPARAGEDY